jgi:GNAT superfamily N-acetyltransferase
MAEFRIEPFQKAKHQRGDFDCGKPPLNEFLRSKVTQYERRHLGRTFVVVRETTPHSVSGYYTVAAGALSLPDLPPEIAAKLPRHPVPVVLLARLAIDGAAQGQGLGRILLVDALRRALELSASLGVFAVEVLAIDEDAIGFYTRFGFEPLLDSPRHLYMPIGAIEEAFS